MSKGWRTKDVITDMGAPEHTSALGIQAVQRTIFATYCNAQLPPLIVVEQRTRANIRIGYVTQDRTPTPDDMPIVQVKRFRSIVGVACSYIDNSFSHINGWRTPYSTAWRAARLTPRLPTLCPCSRVKGEYLT